MSAKINISDRIKEANTKIKELVEEINEYNLIGTAALALRLTAENPDKYPNTKEEFLDIESKVLSLCQKHEIRLPDYVEWNSVEII